MNVILTYRAAKQGDLIDAPSRKRIQIAIELYAMTGYGDVRALVGYPGEYRLRVGSWRVRFSIDAARDTMVVLCVLPRSEAYK